MVTVYPHRFVFVQHQCEVHAAALHHNVKLSMQSYNEAGVKTMKMKMKMLVNLVGLL